MSIGARRLSLLVVALVAVVWPAMLSDFSRSLADRYGIAVHFALHEPDKQGDRRNYHAHVLTTTRALTPSLSAATRIGVPCSSVPDTMSTS